MDSVKLKKRGVDFKQCLFYILDHFWIVVLAGLVCAAALCFVGYKRFTPQTVSKQSLLDAMIDQNRLAYYPTTTTTPTLNSEKKRLDGICTVRGELYLDYDFSIIEDSTKLDYNQFVNRFHQDSIAMFLSEKALENAAEAARAKTYPGTEGTRAVTTDDIRWMINLFSSGNHILMFSVSDISEERALDTAKLLSDSFLDNARNFKAIQSAKLFSEPAVLTKASEVTFSTTSFGLSSALKYIIVGGCAGAALAMIALLVFLLMIDRVYTADDIEYLGLAPYGTVPAKKTLRTAEYKRLAYYLSNEDNIKKLLIVPADPGTDVSELADKLSEALKEQKTDIRVTGTDNIRTSPEALPASKNVDALLLAVSYRKTPMNDLDYARRELEKTGNPILGVVICSNKHR